MTPNPPPPHSAPEFFSSQVRDARRFYLNLAPSRRQPLAVVCGGFEVSAPEYMIDRAGFPYYSIEFVARGKGTLVLAGVEVPLVPGSVFAYGPEVPQRITTDQRDPLAKYFVDFAGQRALGLLQQCALPPGSSGHVSAAGEIQRIFDDLIQNGRKPTRFASQAATALLEYLLLKVAESLSTWQAARTPAFATYQRCRQYIQDNFMRLDSLVQIARQCRVDAAYLCRLFQRYDHQTPYQCLLRLKMNLAAERLQNSGLLVKQVAAEFGFGDPFHFSRAFKNVLGLSPEAFRRLRSSAFRPDENGSSNTDSHRPFIGPQ
jgi:AraC-like DNA-binding protein